MPRSSWKLKQWLVYLETLHPQEIDLGLERVSGVYQRLNSPRPASRIISVAGTNGKGSVCAHLVALATAAGYSSACYSSPHLLAFNERFLINNKLASDADICAALQKIERVRGKISLSYFEFATLAGILLMAQMTPALDLAVFEVGLGGRLDAVNILDADCALISSIALDHQQWLGSDLDSIAAEKAGIFRPKNLQKQTIIIGDRQPCTGLQRAWEASGQKVYRLGQDFDWHKSDPGMVINCDYGTPVTIPVSPLKAPIQNDNLAVAYCALQALLPTLIDYNELAIALTGISLRGRLEKISSQPDIFVDVAHNPAAARVLADWVSALKLAEPERQIHAVCAMLVDKDAYGVIQALSAFVDSWSFAGLTGARGQSAVELLHRVEAIIGSEARCFETVSVALQTTAELAPGGDIILVFGSFVTVEQAIRAWNT